MKIFKYCILLIHLKCLGQSSNCIDFKNINHFIGELLKKDNALSEGLLLDSILEPQSNFVSDFLFEPNKKNEKLGFSEDDFEFLNCQLKENDTKTWDNIIEQKSILLSSKIAEDLIFDNSWEVFRLKYGRGFYSYSLPFFSKDMRFLIIRKSYTCGPTCGYNKVVIFKKEDSDWKEFKVLTHGIK